MRRSSLTPIFDAKPRRGTINPGIQVSGTTGPCVPIFRIRTNQWRDDAIQSERGAIYSNGYFYVNFASRLVVVDVATGDVVGDAIFGALGFNGANDHALVVSASGNYLYLGAPSAAALMVVNISDPTHPTYVTNLYDPVHLPLIQMLSRYGSYLYASWFQSPDWHTTVIDISTESHPTIITDIVLGTAGGQAQTGPIWNDGYGFTQGANNAAHGIYSLASPAAPSLLGSYTPVSPSFVENIARDGNLLWICGGTQVAGGVGAVDITDPANPFPVGITGLPPLTGMGMYSGDGNLGVAIQGQFSRIAVADVSSGPRHLSLAGVLTSSPNLDSAIAVRLIGSTAYVMCQQRLTTVNVSVPAAPVIGSTVSTGFNSANDFCVSGGFAYLPISNGNQLAIYNVSNPAAIAGVGSLTDAVNLLGPRATAVSGNYCFVATNAAAGILAVVDVTNRAAPFLAVGAVDIDYFGPISAAVVGNYLYLGTSGKVVVVDITVPTSPVKVAVFTDPSLTSYPTRFTPDGSTLWVTQSSALVMLGLDISVPWNPVTIGTLPTIANIFGMHITGGIAYAGESAFGLNPCVRAINVSNPTNPKWVAFVPITWANSITLGSADDLYVASEANDFYLFRLDISDPDYPTIIDYIPQGAADIGYTALAWDNNEVYAVTDMGFVATDASLNVLRVAPHGSTYFIKGWILNGDRLYTISTLKLSITDVSDPHNPVILGEVGVPGLGTQGNADTSRDVTGDMSYQNGRLAVFGTGGAGSIYLYDVTGDVPVLIGTHHIGPSDTVGFADFSNGSIVLDGNYIYLRPPNYLVIFDITNPANMVAVGSILNDGLILGSYSGMINNLWKEGNYLFTVGFNTATNQGMFVVIDVSTPSAPFVVTDLVNAAFNSNVEAAARSGNIIYVGNSNLLTAVNINNPTAPTIVGTITSLGSRIREISVGNDNHLYCTCQSPTAIRRVNITDPTHMTLDLSYTTTLPSTSPGSGYGTHIKYIDGVVYIGDTFVSSSLSPYSQQGAVWMLDVACT